MQGLEALQDVSLEELSRVVLLDLLCLFLREERMDGCCGTAPVEMVSWIRAVFLNDLSRSRKATCVYLFSSTTDFILETWEIS